MGNHGSYRRLCRSERLSFLNVYSLVGNIETLAINWGKKGKISEDEVRLYAEGLSKIYQALRMFENKLEPGVPDKLEEEILSVDNVLLPKKEAEQVRKKLMEDNSNAIVNRELIFTLAERAMHWCNPCRDVSDHNTCDLKKVLLEMDIEPYNYECDGTCPYQFKKKFTKGLGTRDDFIAYCATMEFVPPESLILKFETFVTHHKTYYETVNLPEKTVRKFMQKHVPTLYHN